MTSDRNPVLVRQIRGPRVETSHRAAVAVVWKGEILVGLGDVEAGSFLRSGAKFFQALPGVVAGSPELFGLEDRELALACASHNAEDDHVVTARSLLAKGGLEEGDLVCGPHRPMHSKTAALMLARGEEPRRIHNNCSGKHGAMMLAAKARGETHADYARLDHPLQIEIRRLLGLFGGVAVERIEAAVDGCGAPTWIMPLAGAARAFARYGRPDAGLPAELVRAAETLAGAVAREPRMIAGSGRLCTALASVTGGRILAKVGADGFYGAMERDLGLGIAFHLDDGATPIAEKLLVALLTKLEVLSPRELSDLGAFADFRRLNCAGEDVGRIEVDLPEMRLRV